MNLLHMADAAYASNIPPGFPIVAGYYGGPSAYHVWPTPDWQRFPGYRLPIWVGGADGQGEGARAVAALQKLGVPTGCFTAADMETRVDRTYLEAFGGVLQAAGYRVWVYGSASSVFGNPPLNGYWVADYGLSAAQMMAELGQPHVRALQYAALGAYDASLVKSWAEGGMWSGS